MDFQEYDDIMRRMLAMLVKQDGINDRLDAAIDELRAFNRQQIEINADVKTTPARIETLLERVIRPADNGRQA
jgi:hypothetical protein